MPSGGNNKGIPHSIETKQRISEKLKGQPPPVFTRKSCGRIHAFCKVCRPDLAWKGQKITTLQELLSRKLLYSVRIKKALVREGYCKNECNWCGIGPEWNGKPLTLHLDHINGDSSDNRPENFRLLCPNCHSQTETYAWKGARLRKKLVPLEGIEPTAV